MSYCRTPYRPMTWLIHIWRFPGAATAGGRSSHISGRNSIRFARTSVDFDKFRISLRTLARSSEQSPGDETKTLSTCSRRGMAGLLGPVVEVPAPRSGAGAGRSGVDVRVVREGPRHRINADDPLTPLPGV